MHYCFSALSVVLVYFNVIFFGSVGRRWSIFLVVNWFHVS